MRERAPHPSFFRSFSSLTSHAARVGALALLVGIAGCDDDPSGPNEFELSVLSLGTGSGTITSTPAGISCTVAAGTASGSCTADIRRGTVVTLTATPAANNAFAGWEGACTGTGACQVTLDEARTVSARFNAPVPLTVAGGGTGSGTVTSTPAGLNCTVTNGATTGTCQAAFAPGTVVSLTASPGATSALTAWSGACTGAGPCEVTLGEPRTVTATFNPRTFVVRITGSGTGGGTVASEPAGIACTIDRGQTSGSCQGTFTVGTTVTLTPAAALGSAFTGWTGGGCTGTGACELVVGEDLLLGAAFGPAPTFLLRVSGGGGGSGTIVSSPAGISCTVSRGSTSGACQASFPQGTQVTLAATATAGAFAGWGGACTGTELCDVTMDGARNVFATFAAAATLTVGIGGGGAGSVASEPAGIACSLADGQLTGTCSADFVLGSRVRLTATPAAGSVFSAWSGACTGAGECEVTMQQLHSVFAIFLPLVPLTVEGTGTGTGRIVSAPAGIDCTITAGVESGACTGQFPINTRVLLSAGTDTSNTFVGWAPPCLGQGNCQVLTDTAKTISATFTAGAPRTVTVSLTIPTGAPAQATVSLTHPDGFSCVRTGPGNTTCSKIYPGGVAQTFTLAWDAPAGYPPLAAGPTFTGITCNPPSPGAKVRVCSATFSANTTIAVTF